MLLFPTGTATNPVNWDSAAVVSSRKLVGRIFQDYDELVRSVIDLSEEFAGKLEPHQLDNAMNRRLFVEGMKKAGEKISGGLASAVFGYVTSA